MPEEALILKRNPDARYTESYNILFEGRHVGRIYKAVSHAPREAPWFWGLVIAAIIFVARRAFWSKADMKRCQLDARLVAKK